MRLFYGFMSLVSMLLIFLFSSQTGEASALTSHSFFQSALGRFLMSFLPLLGFESPEAAIRKYAHMAEFAFLGFWVMLWMNKRWEGSKSPSAVYLQCLLFCIMYACTDELHQLFVDQRACSLKDVLIDSFGSLVSCSVLYALFVLRERRRKNA